VDGQLRSAIEASHLRGVPIDVLDRLLVGAVQTVFRAGSVSHREGDDTAHLELVVSGAIRVLVTAPDGRTLTVRYCRPGDLLGAMSLFSPGFTMPASVQALVDSRVLRTDPAVVREWARHPDVAHALMLELSQRARGFLHEIPGDAFGTVRQRVVRHLLDLAHERRTDAGEPIVSASQQEVADAAGTVREVVVRVLRELRGEGLVRTRRGEIVLTDVARLVDKGLWNLGS
jgi:CRP/FNR family transcriptional regulator, cyclic AMP receptor protein